MAKAQAIKEYPVSPGDPLAAEHAALNQLLWDGKAESGHIYYWSGRKKLKDFPGGKAILAADPDQSRRYVLAAAAQTQYWHTVALQLIEETGNPAGHSVWHSQVTIECASRIWLAISVIKELLRGKLPLERSDFQNLLEGCQTVPVHTAPDAVIARALVRYASEGGEIDDDLRKSAQGLAKRLREAYDKSTKSLAAPVEQLCAESATDAAESGAPESLQPPPQPAPAGVPTILVDLKHRLGLIAELPETATRSVGLDEFPLRDDSPLQAEHRVISDLIADFVGTAEYWRPDISSSRTGQKLLGASPAELGRVLLALAERDVHCRTARLPEAYDTRAYQSRLTVGGVLAALATRAFSLPRTELFDWILYLSACNPALERGSPETTSELLTLVERDAQAAPLTEGERYALSRWRTKLIPGPLFGAASVEIAQLNRLINDGVRFCLAPGEAWTDLVNEDFSTMRPDQRQAWTALFQHALGATTSRPSAKWLRQAAKLQDAVGNDAFRAALERWLPFVSKGRSQQVVSPSIYDTRGAADTMIDDNATCLRGLLWMIPTLEHADDLTRLVSAVALSAYRKVPGVGPRAVKVGNAAVYALSEIASLNAVGQLAMLKVRVKFGTAQKEIEKAFHQTAEALGLPREEIEELGIPSYGLEPGGVLEESLGDYHAELRVTGSSAGLRWFDSRNKELKSVPAKVRSDHKEDLKELQQSLKDIQGMLPAQRDRIDGMFLLQKGWPYSVWRERYLDHPLVGTIASRLIWCLDDRPTLFVEGAPQGVDGAPVAVRDDATITLWHPIERSIEEITAWRQRLEELAITQPFKQAYREVYLLTDAERNTRTYSNRFAAHVVRQHQFNALCAARGWKNRLRLMVDDSYEPPTKELPLWGLRAEYWVEGIGDDFGVDTNDAGAFLRLATDQVRFYRTGAAVNSAGPSGDRYRTRATGPGDDNINEPLPLDQIPPLVFSEIMRDVDLFVGVASVGNDPTWQDGGPEGRYLEYWNRVSFGELSGTAATRKQVLERLVPRLKIAPQCSFSDRFLIVRGSKRTYKIHLGSGNILMEPNDQYLCIVPDARARKSDGDMYLPFEGDQTLSIIVSKALLLADDARIKDPSINRQIAMR